MPDPATPEPAAPRPTTDDPVRWGVLAPGGIAATFARDLALVPEATLVAAGSRTLASAEAFVAEHGGRAHGSYADLVADPDVEVVYVASPHAFHLEHARLALEAGKHVLCEKPVALNAAEAEEMVAAARAADRFLMEGMWTACNPVVRELAAGLRSGRWGTPRRLHAELGFVVPRDPGHRLVDPALGGGALLDIGVYPVTFAHLLLGEAESLWPVGDLSDRGVDTDVVIAGSYPGGVLVTLSASITSWSSKRAEIATDTGRIVVEQFLHPTAATYTPYDDERPAGEPETITGTEPLVGRGFGNEIAEVGRCVRAGLRESPLVPHEQTLTVMRQLDSVRATLGVHYPGEPDLR
ncbi:Gfo/Idh/MocA family protein [Nocardioides sp. SYSU D00038]|uniref:Gfo/Idh/MocA family protein n=1 Tax=Nocardioides sp. SYSU D00038 TaxID=2812554 RepID=UPI001967106C|nr:Gfo/Idh/MocA family oxidoreductase [Nocardioides sp. SYSU D00038]